MPCETVKQILFEDDNKKSKSNDKSFERKGREGKDKFRKGKQKQIRSGVRGGTPLCVVTGE